MFDAFILEATRRGRCLPHRRVRTTAPDGVDLMAGLFEPQGSAPHRVIVLFHGAGANMNVGYLDLARDLHDATGDAVLVPDVRGHGLSQGPRGAASDTQRVWDDVDLWLDWAAQRYPGAAILLGGHSAGAALCLNRATRAGRPLPQRVTGLFAIAPYFAATARLRRTAGPAEPAFDLPGFAHRAAETDDADPQGPDAPVVRFTYPPQVARLCNLVTGYDAGMAAALSPRAIDAQLAALTLPMQVIAASRDELFPVEGLQALVAAARNPRIRFDRIEAGHLTCLYTAGPAIAAKLATLPATPEYAL